MFDAPVQEVTGINVLLRVDTFVLDVGICVKSREQAFLMEKRSMELFDISNKNTPFFIYSASRKAFWMSSSSVKPLFSVLWIYLPHDLLAETDTHSQTFVVICHESCNCYDKLS